MRSGILHCRLPRAYLRLRRNEARGGEAEVSAKMQRKLEVVDINWMWSADRGTTPKSATLMTNDQQALRENHPLVLDSCRQCTVSYVPCPAFGCISKVV